MSKQVFWFLLIVGTLVTLSSVLSVVYLSNQSTADTLWEVSE